MSLSFSFHFWWQNVDMEMKLNDCFHFILLLLFYLKDGWMDEMICTVSPFISSHFTIDVMRCLIRNFIINSTAATKVEIVAKQWAEVGHIQPNSTYFATVWTSAITFYSTREVCACVLAKAAEATTTKTKTSENSSNLSI